MREGTEVILYALIGLAFCALVGFMIRVQGVSALWWTPLGFVFGLFSTSQMLLPLMMGTPRAIRLVSKQQMRPAVFTRILITPLLWFVGLLAVGYFWPWIADFVDTNAAVHLGAWLGTVAIVLTPLSAKGRSDFRADFDRVYQKFYRVGAPVSGAALISTIKQQAANGDPLAQFVLGGRYYVGRGVPQDYSEAALWFRKAAEQGCAEAQHGLGRLYREGQGVPRDDAQAATWFRKAAEQGHTASQSMLGVLYYVGRGVPQDYAEAYFWCDLAAADEADETVEPSRKMRDEAASHLTPAVLSREQERTRTWLEAHHAKP